MTLPKRLVFVSVLLTVAMIGTGVPAVSAAQEDLDEPPALSCAEVAAVAAATYACTVGDWEACLHVLFHTFTGRTFDEIAACGKYINDGFYEFLCVADGGTFFPGEANIIHCGFSYLAVWSGASKIIRQEKLFESLKADFWEKHIRRAVTHAQVFLALWIHGQAV